MPSLMERLHDLWQDGRGLKWLLLLTALVLQAPTETVSQGFVPNALILTDLNPKTLPIVLAADADNKDVKYKSKSTYKPKTVITGGAKKDVRLMLRAKRDNAGLRAVLDHEIATNDMDYRIRLAFDPGKRDGLVDGASLGFFEIIVLGAAPAEGTQTVRRLEAVYNEAMDGYTVRATDGTDPLGMTLDVADEEVVLRLRLAGGLLFMEAGAPTGPFITNINTTELYSEDLSVESGLWSSGNGIPHNIAWGVAGLGKKATLYFNLMTLWGALPHIGDAETPIAQQLITTVITVTNSLFPSDVATATQVMDDTAAVLLDVVMDLETAVNVESFRDPSQASRALKTAKKALKMAQKAKASGDKLLAAGKTNPAPLGKKAMAITIRSILALVQVGGFRSNSASKAVKTASSF